MPAKGCGRLLATGLVSVFPPERRRCPRIKSVVKAKFGSTVLPGLVVFIGDRPTKRLLAQLVGMAGGVESNFAKVLASPRLDTFENSPGFGFVFLLISKVVSTPGRWFMVSADSKAVSAYLRTGNSHQPSKRMTTVSRRSEIVNFCTYFSQS